MSDQVVFTKEEVEKLRAVIDDYDHVCQELNLPAWREGALVALSILDSPRPRPKVPRQLLNDAYNTAIDYVRGSIDNPADAIANRAHAFGFDVEN